MINFNYNKILKNDYPYIIAEIGVNHGCSLKRAKKLIFLAKKGGAHAAKFQTYKADKLAAKKSKAYWDLKKEPTKSQYELFLKYDKFNKNEYKILFNYCRKIGIDFLSTPFDIDSVDILNPLVPAFKISSSDITNYPLIKKIAQKKKPILLSTGASSIKEIRNAVSIIKKNGVKKIVIMHCILNYPTKNFDANLKMINSLKDEFPKFIMGYSDHTLPDYNMVNLTTAFVFGAKVIEKHFTMNKKLKGNDHYHSMDYKDLKKLVINLKKIIVSFGKLQKKQMIKSELIAKKNARRSIVVNNDVKKNQIIKENDLICLRPGVGISAVEWNFVVGAKAKRNLKSGNLLQWRDIKKN